MAAANGSTSTPKFTLSQISHAVDRFIKVLKLDTERLGQHKQHIAKYKVLEDWTSLHKEHINAARSVQQLKSNIQELGNTRRQIRDSDLGQFDKKVCQVKTEAQCAIDDLLELQGNEHALVVVQDNKESPSDQAMDIRSDSNTWWNDPASDTDEEAAEYSPVSTEQAQLKLLQEQQALEQQRLAEESWEKLQQSLEDVNEIFQCLSNLVHAQQETVDTIEENIEHATEDVTQGTEQLAKGAKWKAAMLPVAGALIGGIIGGPIGLVAGMKIGGAAGLVGGVVGAASGRIIQKNQSQSVDADMAELKLMTGGQKTNKPELSLDDLKKPKRKS